MQKARRFWRMAGVLLLIYGSLCGLLSIGQTRLMFFPSAELKATPAAVELAYEEVWLPMPVGTVHGWWIAAADPAAPVLFYLHGNGSNLGDLVGRARRFHDLGLTVFLIDYRGYGRSVGPFPSERRVYEDAEAGWQYLVQTRRIAPAQIHVFGQSIGGAVAIDLVSRHADASSVMVESTFTSMREMVAYSFPLLPLPVDWLLTQRFDSLSKVRWLQVPILLMHGTADRTVPAAMSQILFAAAASEKQIWFVPNADHNDVAQIGGVAYWQTIREFVARFCRCSLSSSSLSSSLLSSSSLSSIWANHGVCSKFGVNQAFSLPAFPPARERRASRKSLLKQTKRGFQHTLVCLLHSPLFTRERTEPQNDGDVFRDIFKYTFTDLNHAG